MKTIVFLLTLLPFANIAFADNYTLEVNGMRCEYCAKHLESALNTLDGVHTVYVDVDARLVQLDLANRKMLQEGQLKKTIEDAGFTLIKVVEPVAPVSTQ